MPVTPDSRYDDEGRNTDEDWDTTNAEGCIFGTGIVDGNIHLILTGDGKRRDTLGSRWGQWNLEEAKQIRHFLDLHIQALEQGIVDHDDVDEFVIEHLNTEQKAV